MKILKKIGLIAVILLFCLTTTIPKINAQVLGRNDSLSPGETYYLYVSDTYVAYGDLLFSGTDADGESFVARLTSPNNDYDVNNSYLDFEYEGQYFRSYLKYIGTYENYDGYTYNCFEFNVNRVYFITGFDYTFSEVYIDTLPPIQQFSVYNSIYELVSKYLFSYNITPNSYQELTATLLSGFICIFVFALPFLVVWKLIRVIMG